MRLDKFLSDMGIASRKETARAVAKGGITVNGAAVRNGSFPVNPEKDAVFFRGEKVEYLPYVYIMLHKPAGYVSATEDGQAPVVTSLIPPPYSNRNLFPCGRLDKDTVGMMLLTDDGALAHTLLSPRHHVGKEYAFTLDAPLPAGAEERFAAGLRVGAETFLPATLTLSPERMEGHILLTEGKYHQIKRMMLAEGAKVTHLARLSFAGIPLDAALQPGAWRLLTPEEILILRGAPAAAKAARENTAQK